MNLHISDAILLQTCKLSSTHENRLSYQGVGFIAEQVRQQEHKRREHARRHGRVEGIERFTWKKPTISRIIENLVLCVEGNVDMRAQTHLSRSRQPYRSAPKVSHSNCLQNDTQKKKRTHDT